MFKRLAILFVLGIVLGNHDACQAGPYNKLIIKAENYISQQKYREAFDCYIVAFEHPKDASDYYNASLCANQIGDMKHSTEWFQKFLKAGGTYYIQKNKEALTRLPKEFTAIFEKEAARTSTRGYVQKLIDSIFLVDQKYHRLRLTGTDSSYYYDSLNYHFLKSILFTYGFPQKESEILDPGMLNASGNVTILFLHFKLQGLINKDDLNYYVKLEEEDKITTTQMIDILNIYYKGQNIFGINGITILYTKPAPNSNNKILIYDSLAIQSPSSTVLRNRAVYELESLPDFIDKLALLTCGNTFYRFKIPIMPGEMINNTSELNDKKGKRSVVKSCRSGE